MRIKGGETVAYETKVILIAQQIAQAKSLEEAYAAIQMAASAEGLQLPPMDEMLKQLKGEK